MSELRERVALLLYSNGAKGESLTKFSWPDAREWYLQMADEVISAIDKYRAPRKQSRNLLRRLMMDDDNWLA